MNNIELKKRALWQLLFYITAAHSTALAKSDPYSAFRIHAHAELSGMLAMAYYLDIVPDDVKTRHTHSVYATIPQYVAMYNDILALYVECGGSAEFAPQL